MSGAQDSVGFPGPPGPLSACPSFPLKNSVCHLLRDPSWPPATLNRAARRALLRARHYQLSAGPLALGSGAPGQRALLQLIHCPVLSLQTRAGTGEALGERSLNRNKACTPGTQGGPRA